MGSIWAVARNTISQALRMKIAVIVIMMLAILLPLMGIVMGGDSTLKGKLQTFVSYGLSLTSLLLCVMTIAVSTHTLTEEIKRKQIFLVLTKPLRRYELILGKFLGVVILDVFLLALFGGVIFGITYFMPRMIDADEKEVAKANDAFFTSRAVLTDPVDKKEIMKEVNKEFARRIKEHEIASDMTIARMKRVKQSIMAEEIGKVTNIPPGGTRVWRFENVRPANPDDILFVQYKLEAVSPGVDKLYSQWAIGDNRQAARDSKTRVGTYQSSDAVRTVQEFKFPSELISTDGDGYVEIVLHNPYENRTTIVAKELKLLYRAGSFAGNYTRAMGVILTRLIFLAALGVSVSTWLSFPVAILMCVVVFFAGTVNGFIVEAIGGLSKELAVVYVFTIRPLLWLLPVFDGEFNPTPYMVSGEFLKWSTLGKIFLVTAFIKSSLLLLGGMFIFHKREIAKITV
ncbi:MAG: ABC transporter permease [Planctomycetes bacterium]|nr:ABC transporter permease [Planctomycetota bacterium]